MGEFHYEGHRIEYDSYGEGERTLVLVHGLLMNRRMFEHLGPAMARRGNRAICVDLLGHGRSDRPEDLRLYSMPLFARQVAALLDHLGVPPPSSVAPRSVPTSPWSWRPTIPSGSADCSSRCRSSTTRWRRSRRRLPRSCSACGSAARAFEIALAPASAIPRTNYLIDIGLDLARQRPGPSLAVLGGAAAWERLHPHREERRKITQPTALIVGHITRSAAPLQRLRDARRGAAEREAGRGQLDPRVANQPGPAERRVGGVPRSGVGFRLRR